MAPDLAADLDAAARIDPLQHVVDALAARDDLSAATVLVVDGDRAEPRATAGHLDRDQATALVSGLAWRGIRGYPLTDDH